MVAPFRVHLRKGVGDVKGQYLLVVLELEKLVPAVPRHEDEDVRAVVCEETLGAREGGVDSACACVGAWVRGLVAQPASFQVGEWTDR